MKIFSIILTSLLTFTFSAKASTPPKTEHIPYPEIWFHGEIEDAFSKAKKEKKMIFLYWGAVWCPPCNQLKSEVFSKPRFKELAQSVIPYYLDGDHELSQVWGKKFNISGYPTILLMTHNQKELMRLTASMNIKEFEEAFLNGISSQKTLIERVEFLLTGKASNSDWKLVALTENWGISKNKKWTEEKILETKLKLYQKVPKHLKKEKTLFTNQLLEVVADVNEKSTKRQKEIEKKLGKEAKKLILSTIKTPEDIITSRSYIILGTKSYFKWAVKHVSNKDLEHLKTEWIKAANFLAKSDKVSIDERLWAVNADMELYSFSQPNKETYPKYLNKKIIERTDIAVKKIENKYYEKHSVLSGAASLYSQAGAPDKARAVLKKEIKTSDTPWYYQSSLAHLEEKAKNTEKALYWFEQAKNSAKGTSTKLQWIASATYAQARLQKKDKVNKIKGNLKEYYEIAFSMKDGFSGRNSRALTKLLKKITVKKEKIELEKVLQNYQKRCTTLKGNQLQDCTKYFKKVLKKS